MKLKHIYSLLFFNLFFGLILATNLGVFNYDIEKPIGSFTKSETSLPLTGDISVDDQEACLNQTPGPSITFTGSDSDDNFPYTFEYTINDGDVNTISTTDSSPSVSIAAPTSEVGEFTYTLIRITDTNEEEAELDSEITISINSLPEVSIEIVSGNEECSGTPVVFSSTVSGDGNFTYAWEFGDGATSNDPNPSHIYEALGCGTSFFDVTLTVTNENNGCSSSASQEVDVETEPELVFLDGSGADFTNCPFGEDTSFVLEVFNNSSSCITSYDVDWGDGSALETNITSFPISHTYTELGVSVLTITGYGENGCNATKEIQVINSSNPAGSIGSPGNTANLCSLSSPEPIVFFITGWHENPIDTRYVVQWGDGTDDTTYTQTEMVDSEYYDPEQDYPIEHTYSDTHCPDPAYYIDYEIASACGSTPGSIFAASFVTPPEVSFDSPEIECVGTPVTFTNTSTNGFTVPSNGAEDGCSLQAKWRWQYGDGSIPVFIESEIPADGQHTYTEPGLYTVTLTAISISNNSTWNGECFPEPFTRQICIEAPLEPLFSVSETEGCGPLTIEVTNNTDESPCFEVDYLWTVTYEEGYCGDTDNHSFINDTDATSADPEILFTGPGIYSLTLSATNTCGTVVSPPQSIIVKAPPTITLDPIDDVCAPAEITPTYVFDICEATTQEFNWIITGGTSPTDWEFIDGSNASSPNPTINFITPNTYTITVELTNECGTESSSQEFTLQPVPEITNTDLIQTICSGVQVDEIVFESTEPGTTFSWITTATANIDGEVPSGGPGGSIPAHVLTLNPEINSGSVTYSVTPSLGDCEGATVDFIINVVPRPSITTQPEGDAVCIDGITPPLTVAYQDGTGRPTYQWYSNTAPTTVGGTIIPGANQATYTPPTDTSGTIYYYVVISFPGNGGCSDITSEVAEIEVTEQVSINNIPTNEDICVGGSAQELEVQHSEAAGNVNYQWFSNTTNTNTGGAIIPGANSATYTPDPAPFNTVGTYYYYVVVDYSGTNCEPVTSGVYTINVVPDPTVTIDPAGPLEYCQDATPDTLTATPSDGVGTIYNYQWYSNTTNTNTGGALLIGETNSTFTPPTDTVGTVYYYVEITQPISGCANVSEPVEIIVTLGPSITTQPEGDAVCLDGVTPPLTVAYQDGTGIPTYQWYSNTAPTTVGGTIIPGANQATYTPPTDTSGTIYYYVVISFPGNGGCSDITSEVAEIEVTEQVSINNIPTNEDICVGGSAQELEVQHSEAAGNVNYQWFSNTTNTNTGGAIIPGANSATYTPDPAPFNTVGTYYYYVVVDYSGTNCEPVTSGVYTINVVPDPTVTIDPAGPLEYCQDATPDTLTATPSDGVGTIYNYQWYSNTTNTNTGGALLIGETNSTFTPPTDTVGTVYYYVEITQPISGCANVSEPVEIIVTLGPSITTQPEGDSLCIDGITPPLTVAYQDGTGIPTYQWYSNTAPTTVGGTIIPGANQATYTPPTDTSGTIYYYVVISFPGNGGCSDITSEVAEIEVTEQVSINNIPTNEDICVGGSAQELEVQHSEAAGNVNYQWFSNTTNTNTGGAIIPGANSATYTPDPAPFNTVGTYYYYVVVDYSGTNCEPVTSGVYTINVVPDPTVTIDPAGPLEYCQDATPDTLTATPSDGVGTIYNYQWYSNTTNTNTGGALLIGETNSTFTPPTDTVGTVYYYVEITQPISGCANVSEPVEIIVTLGPSITTQPEGDSLCDRRCNTTTNCCIPRRNWNTNIPVV